MSPDRVKIGRHVQKSKHWQEIMMDKESAVSLRLLNREESLARQNRSENGISGATEMPRVGHRERKEIASSDSSEYDVDGYEDGLGSNSSKDHRRIEQGLPSFVDVTENNNYPHKNNSSRSQDKDQIEERLRKKRPCRNSTPVDQQAQLPSGEHLQRGIKKFSQCS